MNKPQIIFTKSDRMTEKQRLFFDMLYAWGRNRYNLLVGLAGLIFSEEEMRNPENCLIRLEAMVLQQSKGTPPAVSGTETFPEPEIGVPTLQNTGSNPEEDDICNAFAMQMANISNAQTPYRGKEETS